MNQVLTSELREVMEAIHYRPAVSLILPFEPKMCRKEELLHALKIATHKVEEELMENYPAEIALLVMQKLRKILQDLNFNTHKKSIAIYVSPVFEKILYLDVAVEEKIIVDKSFEIRDLVYSKKQHHKYLLLVLSGKESRIFLGNSDTFVRILSNTPESIYAYINDVPERVANFSDMQERKQVMMNKFLHHADNGLDMILNAYPLPLFVLGAEKILGHFKKITKHQSSIIEYIHGNYEDISIPMLKEKIEPYILDWKKVKQKDILNHLEEAAGKKKLAKGIRDVWQVAMHQKGRLLVVEKDYMYPAIEENRGETIVELKEPYNKFSYIKDAVDDVIEKVLENGGDVEFVDKDVLKEYDRIALIQFY